MQKWTLILLFFYLATNALSGQTAREKWEQEYQQRITKTHLFDVYIPADIGEAFTEFNRLIDGESRKKFKNAYEDQAVSKLHFSFGRWIIYNWQFYEGSRLSHYMRQLGVYHPDDMARVIIRSYHRYLNKKDLKMKEQVQEIQARLEAEKAKKQQRLDSLAQTQGITVKPKNKN